MRLSIFVYALLLCALPSLGQPSSPALPPSSTPGALNAAVTQSTIRTTICMSGYTSTIRPPASYTTALKQRQMAALGLKGKAKDYEEDHLVSLEIGGNPRDEANLWPQPWSHPGAHEKDKLENRLHKLVCAGTLPLAQAQSAIAKDWWAEYQKQFGKRKAK